MPRVAILFDNFGPYHLTRLSAASGVCKLLAVEFGSTSAEYDWKALESSGLKRVALNDSGSSNELSRGEFENRLFAVLDEFNPEVLVLPGWGYRGALLALCWGLSHQVPVVCMSESTQWDEVRNPVKELIKRRIIGLFSSALVGGTPHRDYMVELGMPEDRIFLGYDIVDNGFFETKTHEVLTSGLKFQVSGFTPSRPYFLASARFIEKKNLFRLLKAYAKYWEKVKVGVKSGKAESCVEVEVPKIWELIILGDGILRPELEALRRELELEGVVHMPGFKQYEELPSYYAQAGAFIHASTTEQWGLVVNEAMASGLPVLVSNRCGCAEDLVQEGINGWTFDPKNEDQIADLLLRISADENFRMKMGKRSREIILEWGPERFASGISLAIKAAMAAPKKKAGLLDRVILSVMMRRL